MYVVVTVEGEETTSSVEHATKQLTAPGGGGSGDATSVKSTSDVSLRRECSSDADSTTHRPSGIGILEFTPDRAGLDVTPANLYEGSPDRNAARYSSRLSTVAGMYRHRASRDKGLLFSFSLFVTKKVYGDIENKIQCMNTTKQFI